MVHRSLKSILLAAIFLAGNLVLPEADILFGHRGGHENETRVHLEQLGGCATHAEHCALSRLLGDLGQQWPSPAAASSWITDVTPRPGAGDLRSAAPSNSSSTLSRAPPALLT